MTKDKVQVTKSQTEQTNYKLQITNRFTVKSAEILNSTILFVICDLILEICL